MKTILVLLALTALFVVGMALQGSTHHQTKVQQGGKLVVVGTQPGDIGKSADIDVAAKARGHELATFAAGCFWGVEERFRQIPGVVATAVGYSGGHTLTPTYASVCQHGTGHAESVLIEFDPKKVSYATLIDVFYKNHNPTTVDRQGPDVGDQYRSAIFFRSPEQKQIAEQEKAKAQANFKQPIVTEVTPASRFWLAEGYHQQYCEKNGIAACPIR